LEEISAAGVSSLVGAGRFKRAVEVAKEAYRKNPGPESEAVLADAYVARVLSFEPHMAVEAESLLRVALERCPSARARIEAARPRVAVRFGRIDEVVGPLAKQDAAEARAAGEDALRRELVDLPALAACTALPGSHTLRRAAAALAAAFEAATTAPVREEDLELPDVPRRSPLAPWKPLIRAIAAFHRGDDDACRAHLAHVDADSAAARLLPALQALLSDDPDPTWAAMVESVRGGIGELRAALQRLDQAFGRRNLKEVSGAARAAVAECRKRRPDLVERLRQRISIRAFLMDVPLEGVLAAIGGPTRHDAAFQRLFALACERGHAGPTAVLAWSRFLAESIREGAFTSDGAEATAVRLRILDILEGVPAEVFARFRAALPHDSGEPLPDPETLDVEALFRRLAATPRVDVFERWMDWARQHRGARAEEAVARAWKGARPGDPRPMLLLMERCERRGALKKALGLLAEAEATERLDPEVARARFRLTSALALRHARERHERLALKDVAVLEGLAETRAGRRSAFVAGLRCLLTGLPGDGPEDLRREVARRMGGEREAFFLLHALARAVGRPAPEALPAGTPAELVAALTASCRLGDDVGVPVVVPRAWSERLAEGLRVATGVDDGGLVALAEAALRSDLPKLAYAAATPGLARRVRTGRFLLLRARSLPASTPGRRAECLAVAADIARRECDGALLGEIRAVSAWWDRGGQAAVEPEKVDRVLAREAAAVEYPAGDIEAAAAGVGARCPDCGAYHGPPIPFEGDSFEDAGDLMDPGESDEDLDDLDIDSLPRLPPELADLPPKVLGLFLEMIQRFGVVDPNELAERDPAFLDRLNRALEEHVARGGSLPGMGRHRRRGRRRRR
jgi:hypothetical protein